MTSLSSAATFSPCLNLPNALIASHTNKGRTSLIFFSIKCDPSTDTESGKRRSKLDIGCPIVVVEAPKMIKTDSLVPCLRVNSGLVNPRDVGRSTRSVETNREELNTVRCCTRCLFDAKPPNCVKKAKGCVSSPPKHWHLPYRWEIFQALRG